MSTAATAPVFIQIFLIFHAFEFNNTFMSNEIEVALIRFRCTVLLDVLSQLRCFFKVSLNILNVFNQHDGLHKELRALCTRNFQKDTYINILSIFEQ